MHVIMFYCFGYFRLPVDRARLLDEQVSFKVQSKNINPYPARIETD